MLLGIMHTLSNPLCCVVLIRAISSVKSDIDCSAGSQLDRERCGVADVHMHHIKLVYCHRPHSILQLRDGQELSASVDQNTTMIESRCVFNLSMRSNVMLLHGVICRELSKGLGSVHSPCKVGCGNKDH